MYIYIYIYICIHVGETLAKACQADGVAAHYMIDEKTPTGTCATLVVGIERSLCTNLEAANNYKAEHCQKAENWKVVQGAKIIYSAGFFATVSPESMKLASLEMEKAGVYCMNLSAPFLMQVPPFKAVFNERMPYVDFLFGNETEALTWAETESWESTDIEFIATRLSLIPSVKSKPRTVVITQENHNDNDNDNYDNNNNNNINDTTTTTTTTNNNNNDNNHINERN